jgi:predicted RNA binding protein YcfA (HicA-like mRNA interferase family)
MKFRVIIEQDEDGIFVANCPTLPGCISQGKTRAEAQPISRRPSKVISKALVSTMNQRGSHIILRQQNPPHRRLTIPDHKEIARGTLKSILREAGLTTEELLRLL